MDVERDNPQQRVALAIQYLGTAFHGWQRQPNQRTVQAVIEDTISAIVQRPTTLQGAGRTDTGVHAAAQVAHFDTTSPIPAHRWAALLNSRLPNDVLIRGSAPVPNHWHARFSADWRRYRYTLYTDALPNLFLAPFVWHYYYAALDEGLMQAALLPLIGRHHLSAFHRANSSRPHSWVEVKSVDCQRQDSFIFIEVKANGFLYGMMRLLVGLLVQVGCQQCSLADFTTIWKSEQRDRVKYSAPAKGLCLLEVGYPEPPFPTEVWLGTFPRFMLNGHESHQADDKASGQAEGIISVGSHLT